MITTESINKPIGHIRSMSIPLFQYRIRRKRKWFFLPNDIVYTLTYRIDEDRFWYDKREGLRTTESHHTKNGYEKSEQILRGIMKRSETLLNSSDHISTEVYSLEYHNSELSDKIRNIEDVLKNIGDHHSKKEHIKGFLLNK